MAEIHVVFDPNKARWFFRIGQTLFTYDIDDKDRAVASELGCALIATGEILYRKLAALSTNTRAKMRGCESVLSAPIDAELVEEYYPLLAHIALIGGYEE